MWNLPRPGIEPVSPTLTDGLLTTGPTGKSSQEYLILFGLNHKPYFDWKGLMMLKFMLIHPFTHREVPDLITYIADLHFNKQKLEEENNKLKLALENLEEANRELSEDCTELRLRVKR